MFAVPVSLDIFEFSGEKRNAEDAKKKQLNVTAVTVLLNKHKERERTLDAPVMVVLSSK